MDVLIWDTATNSTVAAPTEYLINCEHECECVRLVPKPIPESINAIHWNLFYKEITMKAALYPYSIYLPNPILSRAESAQIIFVLMVLIGGGGWRTFGHKSNFYVMTLFFYITKYPSCD